MKRIYFFAGVLMAILCLNTAAYSQCSNPSAFGSVPAPTTPVPITITTCAFGGEYSTVTGALAGSTYLFNATGGAGNFITIRQGTPGGAVLGFGFAPISVTCTASGPLYLHYNVDATCGNESACHTGTVACSSCSAPDPIVNDLCSGAIALTCGVTVTGTTTGATSDAVPTCTTGLNTAPGVWYKLDNVSGSVTLSLCGSSFDTKIGVFTGPCGTFTCVAGNDDFCSLQSQVTFTAVSGTTYYVLVTAFSTNSGAFTLVPTCTQTPVSCTNTTAFGNIAAPTSSAPVTISSCNFAGEYTTVTGCVSGSQYTFASTGGTGNYLTIRQGTPGGAILGQGTSPVTVTCTASGPLYMHLNTNAACGTDASCHVTTVACASCVAPGCSNVTAYGSATAPTTPAPVTISTCNFAGEYATVTGCVSGTQYTFASTGGIGNYLTIRQGTPGGAILGQGTSPVTVTCTASGPIYMHINTNAACGTESACRTTTVACASCFIVGDPCGSITTLTCGTSNTANLTGTGVWSPGSCGFSTPGQEKVYSFTPAVTGVYSLQVTSTSSTGYVDYMYKAASGGCSATGWTCILDIFSPTTATIGTLTAGVQYYILLDAESTSSVSQSFQINCLCSFVPTITVSETSGTPNNGTICIGASATLQANGGGTYLWSTGATTPSIIVSPASTTTYTVTVTAPDLCVATATSTVTVAPLPVATATSPGNPFCVGSTISLNSSGGSTYSWSGPGGFTSTLQNPTRANATAAMAGVYTVTVTSAAGCTSTATVTVSINPLPVVSVTANPNPVCSGGYVQLNATGGGTYAWSGPSGFSSTLSNPGINNIQTTQAGTYQVTVTNLGCNASSSVSVVVNQTPIGTASAVPSTVCVGSSVQLSATGGGTYSWSGPNGFTSTQQNPNVLINSYQQAGVYLVTITGQGGCKSSYKVEVKVNYPPIAKAGHDVATACAGSTLQLTSSGGGSYSWSGPGGFTSTLQNPTIPNATAAYSGLYSVTVTSPNGCTAVATTNVTIVNNPVVTATVDDNTVCEGQTVFLHSSGASSYTWAGPYGYTSAYQHPVINNIPIYLGGQYVVTGKGPTGCTATASVDVFVFGAINGTVSATPNPAPFGSNIQLNATGGTTYLWTGPNGFFSNEQSPLLYNSSYKTAGTYTVIITNEGGCQYTLHVVITIIAPKPGTGQVFEIATSKPLEGFIYPNPANSNIKLGSEFKSSILYSIIDANGNVIIKNQTTNDGMIQINALTPGIYNVIWSEKELNGGTFYGKFVKVD